MSKDEDDYWEGQLRNARRGQLDTVRKAATVWAATFTGVLGIFGSVTFVGGLNGLNDLGQTARLVAQTAVVIAAGATLVATVLTASAANSFPTMTSALTGDSLRERSKELAALGLRRLRAAMVFAGTAAMAVMAGSGVVLFAGKTTPKPAPPPFVVAVIDGHAQCGPLRTSPSGLIVNGARLKRVDQITVVPACPR